jgi:pimeloyl-ACP methyl ester carboxylesterase
MGYADWQTAIRTLGPRGWAEALSRLGGTMGQMNEAQRRWTFAQFDKIPTRALEDYSRLISETDVAPLLARISVPTLILAPTRSAATPLAQQHAMSDAIPNARLVEIDGEAHEIYRDRADDCIAAFTAFLRSVEPA